LLPFGLQIVQLGSVSSQQIVWLQWQHLSSFYHTYVSFSISIIFETKESRQVGSTTTSHADLAEEHARGLSGELASCFELFYYREIGVWAA
jgi:hypothetical protein